MKDTAAQISSDEAVTSVAAAKELLDRHNQVKAEIDAREESVQKIVKTGNKMVQQGHYAKAEVKQLYYLYPSMLHVHVLYLL